MLNANTYITVRQFLDFARQTESDYQSPFFKIYNNNAGASVKVTDTTIVLKTTEGGTDTLTLTDNDKDTIAELIAAINNLGKGWVVNQLCDGGQSSTNLAVIPETSCVGISGELELTGYDLLFIEDTINRATDVINRYMKRDSILSATYTSEYYDGDGSRYLFLRNWPITQLTRVEYFDQYSQAAWALTENIDFIKYENEGLLYKPGRWSYGHKNIRVTYTAGYTTENVPNDIIQACLRFCNYSIAQRGREGLESERIGNYSYTLAGAGDNKGVTEQSIPQEIRALLNPYRRMDLI